MKVIDLTHTLGATGSIGLQTVDVIEQHPDQFCLVGIAAGHQVDVMQKIIDKHPTIQVAGISDVSKAKELSGVTKLVWMLFNHIHCL